MMYLHQNLDHKPHIYIMGHISSRFPPLEQKYLSSTISIGAWNTILGYTLSSTRVIFQKTVQIQTLM